MARPPRDPTSVETAQAPKMPQYERWDTRVRPIVTFAAALAGCLVVALLAMRVLQERFGAARHSTEVAPEAVFGEKPPPPEPRLQAMPAVDLAEHRAREEERLSTYGWIDRDAGVVHIPIERAMQLVAGEGLPAAKNAPAKNVPGADASKEPR